MKINWDKTIQFLKGYTFAIITTSTLALAVSTNIAGFNIFTSGTPISSTAVNDNFGKLAGIEVYKATNTALIDVDNTTTLSTARCNASIDDCSFGAMTLTSSVSNGTYVTESSPSDTNGYPLSLSGGGTFSLVTIATSGWYDFSLRMSFSTMQVTYPGSCSSAYAVIETSINKVESAATSPIVQNEGFGDTGFGKIEFNRDKSDGNCDSTLDAIEDKTKIDPGFHKRVYLTAGDKFYVGYGLKRKGLAGGDNITIPAGNLEFKIVYLP